MADERKLNDHGDDPVDALMEGTLRLPGNANDDGDPLAEDRLSVVWPIVRDNPLHSPTRPSKQRRGWLWMPVPCALNKTA